MGTAADLLLLVLGIGLLLGGGELVVRGAADLARSMGVSSLVVGLTVVAFGTSAPELAVNVTAAWVEKTALSFGNIFGSNMANIGLVVGLTALVRPIAISRIVAAREIPIMIFVTLLAVLMAMDLTLRGVADQYDRRDAVILLGSFLLFMYLTLRGMASERVLQMERTERVWNGGLLPKGAVRDLLLTLGGIVVLVIGARITVGVAVEVARDLGVPEVLVGLTLIAVGTSLPELVTALVATVHGEIDIAIGNVVGSNVFNVLLVGGATAAIHPIPIPQLGHADLAMASFLALALLWVSISFRRTIVRIEGGILLAVYCAYLVWRSGGSVGAF